MIYLGIDGGGSRTRFLLVDEDNKEIARAEAGPSNWTSAGPVVAKESIAGGVRQLPLRPDVVCGGFAGAARPQAEWFYRHTLEELLPKATIFVETDAFVAYVGALGLKPGVLLIAGTGSIVVGRKKDGEMIRVGGWGPFFGDEGSGYWIGREAIRMALRAHDVQRFPDFVKLVSSALGLSSITDIVSGWATGRIGVPAVASLATSVISQYPAEPACQILVEAGGHLRQLVEAAEAAINTPNAPKSVIGSIGNNAVMQSLIGLPFTPPPHSPEFGAILWAKQTRAASDSSRR